MSANSLHLPHLPPELWTTIIWHATRVPGGYDPELTTLALSINANTMNKEPLEACRKALATRRALVRVSKSWYTWASPSLYEYILLGKGKDVLSLMQGMHRSEQGIKPEGIRPIGWRTKRIDVNFRDSTSDPRVDMDALADVMKYLPKLRVLTFSITAHQYRERLPTTILRSVSCPETLKFVHFYTNCLPSMANWTIFLEQHPHLESVNLNDRFFSGSIYTRLSCLQTIHIDVDTTYSPTIPAGASSWSTHFPAVRTATYDLKSTKNEMRTRQFFTNFGPKLTTIQLSQLFPDSDMALEANLEVTFNWILSECPALQQINLLFCSWSILTLFIPRFPSKVTTLVIRIIKGQISKKMIIKLFHETFMTMKGQNLNLKMIQFSSGMNVRGLRAHSKALANGLRRMAIAKLGVRRQVCIYSYIA